MLKLLLCCGKKSEHELCLPPLWAVTTGRGHTAELQGSWVRVAGSFPFPGSWLQGRCPSPTLTDAQRPLCSSMSTCPLCSPASGCGHWVATWVHWRRECLPHRFPLLIPVGPGAVHVHMCACVHICMYMFHVCVYTCSLVL